MNDSDTIQWHNHFTIMLREREKLEDERWEAYRREQLMRDDSLVLQARETHRRLDALNHEAQQLQSMQKTYVPREVYESGHRELVNQLLSHTNKITEQTSDLSKAIAVLTAKITSNDAKVVAIDSSLTWFIRLVSGATILGFLGYLTQHFFIR